MKWKMIGGLIWRTDGCCYGLVFSTGGLFLICMDSRPCRSFISWTDTDGFERVTFSHPHFRPLRLTRDVDFDVKRSFRIDLFFCTLHTFFLHAPFLPLETRVIESQDKMNKVEYTAQDAPS